MKVVGLVSGGKDSCYAMMRCIDYGHEIVALANLLPLEDSVDELDSYMYQTIEKEIEAILIKVAAIGLHPSKHLGRDLATLQPHLLHLKELYGINICGEGGEYETLTLDCPLFKNASIVIDEFQIVLHSSDSIAPVGILHPSTFHLEPKSGNLIHGVGNEGTFINRLTTDLVVEVEGNEIISGCRAENQLNISSMDVNTDNKLNLIVSKTQSNMLTVGCWLQSSLRTIQGLENHLALILKGVEDRLNEDNLGWEDVLYIHLYLADMNQFALANDTYVRYITEGNCPRGVPSRSTIEIPLIEGGLGNTMVEVLATKDRSKKVLHVQSISCWAPSCIGPYSQATLHRQILYMAGQLGLDPPTMMLTPGGASLEMQQALRNCEAVANAFSCSLVSSLISVTVYCPASLTLYERNEIQDRLENFVCQGTILIENASIATKKSKISRPLIVYIRASMLPKRALLEVKPVLYVPISDDSHSEDKIVDQVICGAETEVNDHWGSRDAQWAASCSDSFAVCGHICASIVSIASEAVRNICNETHYEDLLNQSSNNCLAEHKQCLTNIARFCLDVLNKRLQNACLSWEDVLNFRVYFVAKVSSIDTLREAFMVAFGCMSAELHGLKRESVLFTNDPTLLSPVTSFIPVLGIGRSTDMTDLIMCELFASHF